MLAVFTVTNSNDAVVNTSAAIGTLRQAIEDANLDNSDPVDTILFALPAGEETIQLTQGELNITDSVTITGPGWNQLTIDGSGNTNPSRVFDILGSTGDGTSDDTVSGADFLTWQPQNGSGVGSPLYEEYLADFDDDGDVDGDDQDLWSAYSGNSLDLEGILV